VSVVTLGEMWSLAYQFRWETRKQERLKSILDRFTAIPITDEIIYRYAQIDAYSQGKLPERALPAGMTSRNMGKNDLWIAATASITDSLLVTTDHDFDHLAGNFVRLAVIPT
jgi:tRNA(fMet)-specific endonuclease VapC